MTNPSFATIVCDDIRREDNGKLLLIGVYGSHIGILKFPITLRLSLWIKATGITTGEHKFVLNLETSSGNSATLKGTVKVTEPEEATVFVFGGIPVNAVDQGHLVAKLAIDDGEPVEVERIHLRLHDSSADLPNAAELADAP